MALHKSDEKAETVVHHRVCNFCEAMCGLTVTIDYPAEDEPPGIAVRPDSDDPFSQGSMCPKAAALGPLHFDKSRVRQPLQKIDGKWVEISWPRAYDLAETELKKVRDRYGKDAIASYLGNPIVHNLGMMLFVKSLTKAIGSNNVFSATSMDQLPHHFAAHYMFGHEFRIPIPDIDRTEHLIIMGANPLASNGSIMSSAGVEDRLKRILERGGRVTVFDPRRTETAEIASNHHFIKPGSDVFFLLCFLHVLFARKLAAPGELKLHLAGYDALPDLVQTFTPDAVSELTGVSAESITAVVEEFCESESAVIYGRMGVSTQRYGGLCHWLINAINIVSGNFDRAGGMMFPSPAIELVRVKIQPDSVGRWSSRVRSLKEFYGELPVSALAEELEAEGDGQVRAMVTVCGNPVLSTPGGGRLDSLIPKLDFVLCIDNYINETTRHADLILPTPSGLEVDHYDLIFNTICVNDNVKFSEAAFPADPQKPYDWQILKELSRRLSRCPLGFVDRFATPRRIVNWGLMLGPYGALSHPRRWFNGLTLRKVIDSKHGISLGNLKPRVPDGLLTRDKKIQMSDKVFIDEVNDLSKSFKATISRDDKNQKETDTFQLIGRRHVATNNSWMHQFKRLSASRQVRCTCMMNPQDAARIGAVDGALVRVSSKAGSIELPVEHTNTVLSGVVCIPHGFGHTRADTRVPNAQLKPGVSVNDITDHLRIDSLTGNAAFSGLALTIETVGSMATSLETEPREITGLPIAILYGSRTGNAQIIAKDVAHAAAEQGLVPVVCAMSEVTANDFLRYERILIVCSTYGDGDMPDSAHQLWREMSADGAPDLKDTNFSVLALGDTNYPTFCAAGKNWDSRLAALGATRTNDRVDCDVDYTANADQWTQTVIRTMQTVGSATTVTKIVQPHNQWYLRKKNDRDEPLTGVLTQARELTGDGSSKSTSHYEIQFENVESLYTSGDIVNVCVRNDLTLACKILELAKLDESSIVDNNTLLEHLHLYKDIRVPSKALLTELATSPDSLLIKLLEVGREDDLEKFLYGRDIVQLLQENSRRGWTTEEFLSLLRPLPAKSYSIASSPVADPGKISLTVSLVQYNAFDRLQTGAGSGYLANEVDPGDEIRFYFVANESFSLPDNPSTPVIMIGPGSGVAPFRAFLRERRANNAPGKNWLFFGERNEATDFLYQDEFQELLVDGVLTRLDVAFSRDQQKKIYVQDRIRESGAELFQWLEDGAALYVCGDAKRMAIDVDLAIQQIVEENGRYSSTEARAYLQNLIDQRRYLKDVY